MIRAYRFAVTVYIDGDKTTLPEMPEIAEHVATQVVQNADDHDLAVCVRPIETEDYDRTNPGRDDCPKTKGHAINPRPRKPICGSRCPKDALHPKDGYHTCRLAPNHVGEHVDTRNPMHPAWGG